MTVVGTLLVNVIGSNSALKATYAESTAASSMFASKASAASSIIGRAVNLASVAAFAGVGAVAAFGVESVNAARSFQSSMELVRTQAGASQAEVDSMSKAILNMAGSVGTGPDALAAGLYHIESAGIRGAQALDVLTTAAEGAKVGHADLESVTNALIATVNSGIGGVSNMSQAMGVLNSIVGSGNMRMQDLADAMSTGVLSSAKAFGINIQSLGAAIADMTNQGVPAIDAATRLRMTISLLGAPSSKAQKDLASIGISATQLALDMRTPGGILTAAEDLKRHLDDSGLSAVKQAALLSNAFGGGRSSSAILTLLGSLQKFGTIQTQVTNGTKAFGDAWAATQQTAQEKWDAFNASLGSVSVQAGNVLLPMITDAMNGLATWISANGDNITNFFSGVVTTVEKFGSIVAPAIGAIGSAWASLPDQVKALIIGGFLADRVAKWVFGIDAASIASAGIKLAASFLGGIAGKVGVGAAGDLLGVQKVWIVGSDVPLGGGGLVQDAETIGAGGLGVAGGIAAALGGVVALALTGPIHNLEDALSTALGGKPLDYYTGPPGSSPFTNSVPAALPADPPKSLEQLQAIKDQLVGPSLTALQGIKDSTSGLLASSNPTLAAIQSIKDGTTATAASMVGAMDDVRTQVADSGAAQALAINRLAAVMTMQGGSASQSSQHLAKLGIHAFAAGGIVPGSGAQLAIVHGGEFVIPPDIFTTSPAGPPLPGGGGRSGASVIQHVSHIHVEIDRRVLAEAVDELLLQAASGFSSGFLSGNPVTGA